MGQYTCALEKVQNCYPEDETTYMGRADLHLFGIHESETHA